MENVIYQDGWKIWKRGTFTLKLSSLLEKLRLEISIEAQMSF